MPLVKAGRVIEDKFTRVLDDATLPENAPVLIPAARYLADNAELLSRAEPVGVIWPNSRKISELAPHLHKLALVALVFPNFCDGRAYSQGRLLREQYGYRGELRATGEILRDQFLFLVRAGFDALEVKKNTDVPAYAAAIARYSVYYQPTGLVRRSALQERIARQREGWETLLPESARPTG